MATVLLLRAPHEAQDLGWLLEEEGATVIHWPLLSVSEVVGQPSLLALGEQLGRFSYVIPESPTAVRVLSEVVRAAGASTAAKRAAFLAPSLDTVRALARHGLEARHVLPEREEGRLETLASLLTEDDEVLWVGGEREAAWRGWLDSVPGRATLVKLFDAVSVPSCPEVPERTVVVVHSPSAAEALAASTEPEWRERHRVVASGPATSSALAELGVQVHGTATKATTEALFEVARAALVDG